MSLLHVRSLRFAEQDKWYQVLHTHGQSRAGALTLRTHHQTTRAHTRTTSAQQQCGHPGVAPGASIILYITEIPRVGGLTTSVYCIKEKQEVELGGQARGREPLAHMAAAFSWIGQPNPNQGTTQKLDP